MHDIHLRGPGARGLAGTLPGRIVLNGAAGLIRRRHAGCVQAVHMAFAIGTGAVLPGAYCHTPRCRLVERPHLRGLLE